MRVEPSEMYTYLMYLKRLKANYDTSNASPERLFEDSDKELDDLIEAFNITKEKCNIAGFISIYVGS